MNGKVEVIDNDVDGIQSGCRPRFAGAASMTLPHQPQDEAWSDPEVVRDLAIRDVRAAVGRLYETMPAAFAHQFATDARDEADRDFRRRPRS